MQTVLVLQSPPDDHIDMVSALCEHGVVIVQDVMRGQGIALRDELIIVMKLTGYTDPVVSYLEFEVYVDDAPWFIPTFLYSPVYDLSTDTSSLIQQAMVAWFASGSAHTYQYVELASLEASAIR